MKVKKAVLLGLCFTMMASVGFAADKTFNLKFAYQPPPRASIVVSYLKPWTEKIAAESGGKINITMYASESLVKTKDQFDAVNMGICDMAMIDPAETPGRFPHIEFDTLPLLFPDSVVGVQVYYDILQKYAVDTDLKDVKLVSVAMITGNNWGGNVPCEKLSDLKGKRVRIQGRIESWVIEALGASPIEIATSDLSTSLDRGLIDGCFVSWSAFLAFGVKDVTQYTTAVDLQFRAWPIIMNKKIWDSMGPELQKVIADNSTREVVAKYTQANVDEVEKSRKAIEASNKAAGKLPVVQLDAAERANWKKAVEPVLNRWAADADAKGANGTAVLADVKALAAKYAAAKK